jgi:hypothetical protein
MNKAARSNRPLCPSKFKVGERVTENMKSITYVSPFADKKIKDTVAKYLRAARVGTVKEVFVKTNKRGDRRHYATVLWDHLKSPTEHEQGRLKIQTDTEAVTSIELEKTEVPKTTKKKISQSVEISNLNTVRDKDIFTAKTEEGYVGCVRMSAGVCLTIEVFSSALEAANKARSLKRQLELPKPQECRETQKKTEEIKKCVVKKTNKKVAFKSVLYTFDETKVMPLLRFQEVWVIIKDSMYVSDCLDKERRNLVSYTSDKEEALHFTCHEKAKMTMRVLKGAIGPGFDLKRFFVENK